MQYMDAYSTFFDNGRMAKTPMDDMMKWVMP